MRATHPRSCRRLRESRSIGRLHGCDKWTSDWGPTQAAEKMCLCPIIAVRHIMDRGVYLTERLHRYLTIELDYRKPCVLTFRMGSSAARRCTPALMTSSCTSSASDNRLLSAAAALPKRCCRTGFRSSRVRSSFDSGKSIHSMSSGACLWPPLLSGGWSGVNFWCLSHKSMSGCKCRMDSHSSGSDHDLADAGMWLEQGCSIMDDEGGLLKSH
jgi:hypothetical protein